MNRFSVVLSIFFLAGCHKESPTEIATPFLPGTWAGPFNTRILQGEPPDSGTISIHFTDSVYHYTGDFTVLRDTTRLHLTLNWGGKFNLVNGTVIHLVDYPDVRPRPWNPASLGLYGSYTYRVNGKTMTVSNLETYYPITLTLTKQD